MKKKFDDLAEKAANSGHFDQAIEYDSRGEFLYEYGVFMGELRKIVGVHHPTDVAAGQSLGKQVCEYVWAQPDWKEKFLAVPVR